MSVPTVDKPKVEDHESVQAPISALMAMEHAAEPAHDMNEAAADQVDPDPLSSAVNDALMKGIDLPSHALDELMVDVDLSSVGDLPSDLEDAMSEPEEEQEPEELEEQEDSPRRRLVDEQEEESMESSESSESIETPENAAETAALTKAGVLSDADMEALGRLEQSMTNSLESIDESDMETENDFSEDDFASTDKGVRRLVELEAADIDVDDEDEQDLETQMEAAQAEDAVMDQDDDAEDAENFMAADMADEDEDEGQDNDADVDADVDADMAQADDDEFDLEDAFDFAEQDDAEQDDAELDQVDLDQAVRRLLEHADGAHDAEPLNIPAVAAPGVSATGTAAAASQPAEIVIMVLLAALVLAALAFVLRAARGRTAKPAPESQHDDNVAEVVAPLGHSV